MSANPKIAAIHNKKVRDDLAIIRAEHEEWLANRKVAKKRMEERSKQALKYIMKSKGK